MDINDYKDFINRKTGERNALVDQLQKNKGLLKEATDKIQAIIDVQTLIQRTAVETQELIRINLEDIVNKVLQTVFPSYSFEMKYAVKYGKSDCSLCFYCDGYNTDLLDGDSGGALNTACVALRLAVWTISSTDNCLILDEAFANLSQEAQPLIGQVLSELSKQLHLQTILVSHSPNIDAYADTVYRIAKKDGVSHLINTKNF